MNQALKKRIFEELRKIFVESNILAQFENECARIHSRDSSAFFDCVVGKMEQYLEENNIVVIEDARKRKKEANSFRDKLRGLEMNNGDMTSHLG